MYLQFIAPKYNRNGKVLYRLKKYLVFVVMQLGLVVTSGLLSGFFNEADVKSNFLA